MRIRIGIDARLIRAYGIGSYVRGLLRGLASLEGDEEYVVFARPDARSLVPERFDVIETSLPPYSIQELPLFGRLVDRARLDLFHAPHFTIPWTGTRVVATLYDAIPFHYPLRNPVAFSYIAFMMQRAAVRAERIFAISHAAKRDLVGALDCDPGKITVIPIGVDDLFFRADGPRATDLGRYFLFVGRVARHKNIGTLLDALAIVRRRDPSMRVVLAGGEHPSREGAIVPGYVDEERLLALYRGAIAVVMPSFMEGFGLPPLEGMALGTPAITSNAPALVEVTGDAALHFDAASAEQLAAAMERLAGDAGLRAELSRRGLARAQGCTWRRCAEETRAVYRRTLHSHP
ncbi:MAG TPA: glycosyltransferase family 1 protein [Thermoanaerobaculia bacterium]|nr:glycosyltransferase family 1 protein [Thermoanaerobaculia bacterium]